LTDAFQSRPIEGRSPDQAELGPAGAPDPRKTLAALRIPQLGRIYDLDTGRWPGMTLFPSAPPFQVLTYRTPAGLRASNEFAAYTDSALHFGWIDEVVFGSVHSGTHVDALSHVTIGEDDHWFGGYDARTYLGDRGPTRADGSSIPPLITRGVLVDAARHAGVDVLPAGHRITEVDLIAALASQRVKIEPGDAVLVHTGFMRVWQTKDASETYGAGLSLDAARWLADAGVVAVGADNENVEAMPSGDPLNPTPVHVELLIERGVIIIETMYLEALAQDRLYEFLFVCNPPRIKGTSGGFVRPIAIA
jgi:kynurenine formamidase